MRKVSIAIGSLVIALGAAFASSAEGSEATKPDAKQVERGRYLLALGSCNDCHTAGFAPSNGTVPEKQWLMGDATVGFRGPWGTTYATNLRLSLSKMTESQWVQYAKHLKARPPMPWFNLNKWDEEDLRAFYHYVRQLGPLGKPAPDAVPPHKEPKGPVVSWPRPPAK